MRLPGWSGLLTCALGFLWAHPALAQRVGPERTNQRRIELSVGEQTVIPARNVDKYSEGTPGIVDVRLPADGSEFVIVARKPGKTTLLLLMEDQRRITYHITVGEVRVSRRDNIRLDFYFVELSRDDRRRIGIGWPGTIGGTANVNIIYDLEASTTTSATASVASEVLPRIDIAQSGGWARILREASVIVANGERGMFETGGELNFRVFSSVATDIEQITFGSRVEVEPRFDQSTGMLDIKITAVVSELTDIAPDGLPGRAITSLETLVNLELGQSLVLAGIHSESLGRNSEGLPLLSQIPVLGYLFGSKSYRSTKVENLIFIVPSVVQSMDAGDRSLVTEALDAFRDYSGDLGDAGLRETGLPAPSKPPPPGKE